MTGSLEGRLVNVGGSVCVTGSGGRDVIASKVEEVSLQVGGLGVFIGIH